MLDIGLCLKLLFARFLPNIFLSIDYCPIINKTIGSELISVVLSDAKVMKNCVTFLALFHDYRRTDRRRGFNRHSTWRRTLLKTFKFTNS